MLSESFPSPNSKEAPQASPESAGKSELKNLYSLEPESMGVEARDKVTELLNDEELVREVRMHLSVSMDNLPPLQLYKLFECFSRHTRNEIKQFTTNWLGCFKSQDRARVLSVMLETLDSKVFNLFFELILQAPKQIYEEDDLSGGVHTYQTDPRSSHIQVLLARTETEQRLTSRVESFIQENSTALKTLNQGNLVSDIKKLINERTNKFLYDAIPQAIKNWDYLVELNEKYQVLNEEAELLIATVASIIKQGEKVNFSELKDLRFFLYQAYELANEELEEMKIIYAKNYPTPPYPKEFRDSLISSLYPQDEINSHFYIIKHQERIVSFARFENLFNNNGQLKGVNFGAFNLDPAYKGALIGEEMMRQFIYKEAGFGVPVTATCDPKSPIAKKYIASGFVGTNSLLYHEVPVLKIELNTSANAHLQTKRMEPSSPEALAKIILQYANTPGHENIRGLVTAKNQELDFSLCNEGFVLTQFIENKATGKVYCLFEKPNHSAAEFLDPKHWER